ncbi:MAG: ribosome hibernation-promoting factor, HPF/YfiA family [Anaerolineae bacterium]
MVDINKFAEEDAQGYKISVIGRNVQVSEAMKNYVIDKLSKIERFHSHIMHVHVTMDIQKLEHSVVILLKLDHFNIKVQANSTDMYASIDKAINRLQAQLRRWKGRIQDYTNKKDVATIDMQVNVLRRPYNELSDINEEIDLENVVHSQEAFVVPKVIGSETLPLKTLKLDEAVMKIELSGEHFLLFRDEMDRKLKVIYRRDDGNYGIMQPE